MESTTSGELARPLLVTTDVDLLDDLLRLGAAAGVQLAAVPDVVAARSFWAAAPLVLIGDDAARSAAGFLARARLRRRANVVLVSHDGGDDMWPRAVGIGADQVCVLPDAESALLELLANAAEPSTPFGVVVAVIGGRGGAGASSLAAALAVTAARAGERVTFVDADPLSGGADLLFGGETAAGVRWSDLVSAQGRIPASALRAALPQVSELAVLSWDRSVATMADAADHRASERCVDVEPEVMVSVLDAVSRASQVVVVDLPRRVDQTTRAVLAQADLLLVITPAEVRAAAATSQLVAAIAAYAADARLVVRGPAPGGLRATEVAAAVGLPLAGELRQETHLASCLERGEPPAGRGVGPLARLCEGLLEQLRASRVGRDDADQWLR